MKIINDLSIRDIDKEVYESEFPDYNLQFYILVENVKDNAVVVADFYSNKVNGNLISEAKSTIFDIENSKWQPVNLQVEGYSIVSINNTELKSYEILNTISKRIDIWITNTSDNCCLAREIVIESTGKCSP